MDSSIFAYIFLLFVGFLIVKELFKSLIWINRKVIKNSYFWEAIKYLLPLFIAIFGTYLNYLASVNENFQTHLSKIETVLGDVRMELNIRDLKVDVSNIEWQDTISEMIYLQSKEIPCEPDLTDPLSVGKNWFTHCRKTNVETIKKTQIILARKKERLSGLNLDKLDLSDYDFKNDLYEIFGILSFDQKSLDFSKANFKNSSLERMKAINAYLSSANFDFADLRDANFLEANLQFASFESAYLSKAVLRGAILVGANLKKSNLKGANLTYSNLIGANLENAFNLDSADLKGTIYNSKPTKQHPQLDYNSFTKAYCAEGQEDDQCAINKCIYRCNMNSHMIMII